MANMTQVERIAMMEVKLIRLEETVKSMDQKLDDLLALRNKGAGIFWLASCLLGTGIVGFLVQFTSWLKGV